MKLSFIDITGGSEKDVVTWSYSNKPNGTSIGSYFSANNHIGQRIQVRYGKSGTYRQKYESVVESVPTIHDTIKTNGVICSVSTTNLDNVPVSIGTNAKNLNPFIHIGTPAPGCENTNMVVLTIGTGVSYIRSSAHEEVQVINTFREQHHNNMYKGCCIMYHDDLCEYANNTDHGVISLMKIDTLHGETLLHHEVIVDLNNNISVLTHEIAYESLKSKLMSIYETTNKRRGFVAKWWSAGTICPKMDCLYGSIPTLSINDISQDELDDPTNPKTMEYIDLFRRYHNRALIIDQLRLPRHVIAELKLLYIFTVDETGKLRTIKSN